MGARSRRLAFRSGDRLPVLARVREEARLGSAPRDQRLRRPAAFGAFEDEWLRGGPVQRWVPKALRRQAGLTSSRPAARPASRRRASASTTSGSTTRSSATTLPDEYFPEGLELADARAVGPAAAAAGGRAPGAVSRRHLLLRRSRSALGDQADQEGLDASTCRPTRITSSIRR